MQPPWRNGSESRTTPSAPSSPTSAISTAPIWVSSSRSSPAKAGAQRHREKNLDPVDVGYARKLGVRTDDLLVSQPDCGEQALEITEMLVRSGAVDVIVVDSVAALTPRAELEGEMGDSHVGLQARLMSQALRKLTARSRSRTRSSSSSTRSA